MKKRLIACLAAGLFGGIFAAPVVAKLPPAPPVSDADKASKAEKAAAAKAKEAEQLGKAQDRAAANYKTNKGMAEPKAAAMAGKKGK